MEFPNRLNLKLDTSDAAIKPSQAPLTAPAGSFQFSNFSAIPSFNIGSSSMNKPPISTTAGSYNSSALLASLAASQQQKKKVNTKLYKTNLCRTFSKTGDCPYGAKCQFAHGEAELRPVPPEFDDTKKLSDVITTSSPRSASVLFAGVNAVGIASPRISALQVDTSLTSFSLPQPMLSGSAGASSSNNASSNAMSSSIPGDSSLTGGPFASTLFSPKSFADNSLIRMKVGSISSSSPRVALLNLAANPAEKPIPEGARVDCDPRLYKTELCRSFSREGFCRYGAKCQFAHGIEELRPAPQGSSVTKILKLKSPGVMQNNFSTFSHASALEIDSDNHESGIVMMEGDDLDGLVEDPEEAAQHEENDRWAALRGDFTPKGGVASLISPRIKDPRVYKTELCQKFEEMGECPYGPKCQFAHGKKELRSRSLVLPGPMSLTSPKPNLTIDASLAAATGVQLTDDIKSPKSQEQDSVNLISSGPDPKLYKTELCRSFNRAGYCRYGLKCQFAHGIHELRPSPRLVNAALKIGVDVIANVASEADSKYTPMSPRNLSGSAVIASPTNRKVAGSMQSAGNAGLQGLPGFPVLPSVSLLDDSKSNGNSGAMIRGIDGNIPLPKASPTARQAFSFAAPISPQILEEASKVGKNVNAGGAPASPRQLVKSNSFPAIDGGSTI